MRKQDLHLGGIDELEWTQEKAGSFERRGHTRVYYASVIPKS